MLLGCFVVIRLVSFVTTAGLMPSLQSAYRVNQSTETAVLGVLPDGVAPEWSIPLMPGMHRSGPRQGRRRVAAAEEAEPGL